MGTEIEFLVTIALSLYAGAWLIIVHRKQRDEAEFASFAADFYRNANKLMSSENLPKDVEELLRFLGKHMLDARFATLRFIWDIVTGRLRAKIAAAERNGRAWHLNEIRKQLPESQRETYDLALAGWFLAVLSRSPVAGGAVRRFVLATAPRIEPSQVGVESAQALLLEFERRRLEAA